MSMTNLLVQYSILISSRTGNSSFILFFFFFFLIYVKSILLIDFMNTYMVNDKT